MEPPKPVQEEECQVKIRPSDPVDPGVKCGDEDGEGAQGGPGLGEAKCQLKTTNYSKLAAKYFREGAPDPRSRRSASEVTFHTLRDQFLARGQPFVDDTFPPVNQSINFSGVTNRQYEWKRPHEIVKDPRFFIEGATRFDIQQGELGDCWLLAAISSLTMNPTHFHYVVPYDQGFRYKYAGIFHFRFWQYGRWEDIYIDDLLPTYRGRLVFMRSKTKGEFWCALLEKAYAKLYGGYEALKGGNVGESMVDLTGGVVETVDLQRPHRHLFNTMSNACKRGAMMGCGIEPDDPNIGIEGRLGNGLIARHAYSVTKVIKIRLCNSEVELVRLHNPWGNEAEWKGAWCDESPEWKSVSEEERAKNGITFDDDGEFWMPFTDFLSNFTTMDVCDVTPDVFATQEEAECGPEDEPCQRRQVGRRPWKMRIIDKEWLPGKTAGGCRNFLDTFSMNPQMVVLLDKIEEGREECMLVVSLMQKFVRQRKRYGVDYVPIGFAIYNLPPGVIPGKPLDTDFFRYNVSCGKAPFFLNTRDVSYHFHLPPGVYVVIPSTFEPNCKGEFFLRVFTEGSSRSSGNSGGPGSSAQQCRS